MSKPREALVVPATLVLTVALLTSLAAACQTQTMVVAEPAQPARVSGVSGFASEEGQRLNAIWVKTTEDRAWVTGYTGPDFSKKGEELQAQGYRPLCVNAFLLPGVQARFSGVWAKTGDDRRWLLGYARPDFEKQNTELAAQGYKLVPHFISSVTYWCRGSGLVVQAAEDPL